jgi:hypothetical protein
MSQKGSVIFRVLAAVILVSVMVGGVFMAYQAGQAQGYALGVSGSGAAQSGTAVQPVPSVPYYPGMMGYHFHPFMGFFAIIPMLVGICLFFGLIRLIIWGPRHRHYGPWMYGPCGEHPWHGGNPWGEPGTGQPQEQGDKEKK